MTFPSWSKMPSPVHARDRAGERRDHAGDKRDDEGQRRDRAADRRDEAAARRDEIAEQAEALMAAGASSGAQSLSTLARREAASDRRQASHDRRAGASERTEAELDRDIALADRGASARELHDASLDALTGLYTRGTGMARLEQHLTSARKLQQPLVVAFLDVDRLKAVNDTCGHAAGDRLLVNVARCLVGQLCATDLIIRVGGDEFVCALTGLTLAEAAQRFTLVNVALANTSAPGSITVGLAQAQPDESATDLVVRADVELYRTRRQCRPAQGDHEVVFYDDDAAFCAQLEVFLTEGVLAAEQVVAIITPTHRALLKNTGCLLLDAQETLDRVMDLGGLPDLERFESVVGALVRSLAGAGPVRAYGEMVAVLWEQGNILGALRLEELWNDLLTKITFHLRCAYPLRPGQEPVKAGMGSVSRLHTHVRTHLGSETVLATKPRLGT